MRIVTCFCVTTLFFMSLATPRLTSAQDSGPAAHGNVQVSVGDDVTRNIKFNVETEDNGTINGDIRLDDPSATVGVDPDNPDASSDLPPGLSVQVEVDCLVVQEKRAAMSGVVVDSNIPSRIGQRVLLAAEDNGEGAHDPLDKLTWGVYTNHTRTWTPSDAEWGVDDNGNPLDQGASLTWTATDAEREDDVGVPSTRSEVVDCHSFPLSSYAMVEVQHGDGNIQILP